MNNVVPGTNQHSKIQKELLEIVNEDDQVIGNEIRKTIHQKGLLHREIHVWLFKDDEHKLLFQHRAKDKETYPDLLDASAGGHVDPGETYEQAALRELAEEVGIRTTLSSLIPIAKVRHTSYDNITQKTNNTHRMIFAYRYNPMSDLIKIESGMSQGFEWWSIKNIFTLSNEQKKTFIPSLTSTKYLKNFKRIEDLI